MAEAVDGYEFWQADHTALVHVLWVAEDDGLTLKAGESTDELASRILQSEWFSAVLAHADTLKRIRGNKGTLAPAREVREYTQWGNLLHPDARPVDGQEPGTVSSAPGTSLADRAYVRRRNDARIKMGIGDTIMRRTVRVVTEYGEWEEVT